MNKKSIEDKFSIDIDAYFNGIQEPNESNSKEYNELLNFSKTLANKDFSKNSNKQKVFNKTLKNINEYRGGNIMKNLNKMKFTAKIASLMGIGIISISLMQPAYARNLADKVIKTISLGHVSIIQTESPKIKKISVPKELKGKIFDKDGKPIEVFTKDFSGKIYTAKGEEIDSISNNKIITVAEQEKIEKDTMVVVKDPTKLNKYTCFNVILPSYLPKDYKFDKANFYKDDKGVISDKYIDLCFTNSKGKSIYLSQCFACEETKCESGTDGKIEEIKINGVDAVISDNRSIDWEYKNVIYFLSGKGEISKNDLIKIAKSIK